MMFMNVNAKSSETQSGSIPKILSGIFQSKKTDDSEDASN